MFTYVSQHYPSEVAEALQVLGVELLSDEDFLEDLEQFTRSAPKGYRSMPGEWHSHLSEVLEGLDSKHRDFISALPLIPRGNGEWISPKE